jgi:quercetin dioxygenase-like cupin family protein
MTHYQWSEIPVEQMNPLFDRQVIHAGTITLARLVIRKGAVVPRHSHVNEQISTIEKGSLTFQIEGKEITVRAGESLVIPPHVPHSAEAREDCVAVDVFSPVREDWVTGNDAYLRG